MTVEPPESDSNIEGMTSYAMDGIVHAVVTRYDDGDHGQRKSETECGLPLPDDYWKEAGGRRRFDGEMCSDCWPDLS